VQPADPVRDRSCRSVPKVLLGQAHQRPQVHARLGSSFRGTVDPIDRAMPVACGRSIHALANLMKRPAQRAERPPRCPSRWPPSARRSRNRLCLIGRAQQRCCRCPARSVDGPLPRPSSFPISATCISLVAPDSARPPRRFHARFFKTTEASAVAHPHRQVVTGPDAELTELFLGRWHTPSSTHMPRPSPAVRSWRRSRRALHLPDGVAFGRGQAAV